MLHASHVCDQYQDLMEKQVSAVWYIWKKPELQKTGGFCLKIHSKQSSDNSRKNI